MKPNRSTCIEAAVGARKLYDDIKAANPGVDPVQHKLLNALWLYQSAADYLSTYLEGETQTPLDLLEELLGIVEHNISKLPASDRRDVARITERCKAYGK